MSVVNLPSIRRLVLPDEGYTLIDADLERADAQFVAWEADEPELKHIFQQGLDIYTDEAKWLYNVPSISKPQRQALKSVVHAADYGGKARTLASTAGCSIARMEEWLNKRWYARFPGILRWHRAVERQLRLTHEIRNVWGFRRFYFDNIDTVLPQALAWLGQSGCAVAINRAMRRLRAELPEVQLLLQVHDSLLLQVRTDDIERLLPQILRVMRVEVPYKDTLVIPVSVKMSDKSWGDVA